MGSWGEPWTLYEVCDFLGHSDIEVTQRYAHLSPEHLHKKAALTAVVGPRVVHDGQEGSLRMLNLPSDFTGAGDRDRTGDVQLGKMQRTRFSTSPTVTFTGQPVTRAYADVLPVSPRWCAWWCACSQPFQAD